MPAPTYDTGQQAGSQANSQGAPGANNTQTFALVNATSATVTGLFELTGGKYGLSIIATTSGGSIQLNKLGPDGVTLIPLGTALTATGKSYQTLDLPRGMYQWVMAAPASGVFTEISRCPQA